MGGKRDSNQPKIPHTVTVSPRGHEGRKCFTTKMFEIFSPLLRSCYRCVSCPFPKRGNWRQQQSHLTPRSITFLHSRNGCTEPLSQLPFFSTPSPATVSDAHRKPRRKFSVFTTTSIDTQHTEGKGKVGEGEMEKNREQT